MTLPFNFDPYLGLLDTVAMLASLIFTLMIFSYVIGDNFLFRVALYIFAGVSAGYIASVAWWQVLLPRLVIPLATGSLQERILLVFPAFGILLILLKISPRLAGIGRLAMAFIVGAGAAVTIAGALSGTLIPQVQGTIDAFDPNRGFFNVMINGVLILVGAVLSLIYFHFGARTRPDGSMRRLGLIELLAVLGRAFIGITLGVIFAGVYAAALTALIERVQSILNIIGGFF